MNPYIFKELTFDKGSFDDSLDATYIIHLEGNKQRYDNIIFQLNKFAPTRKVYILFNKGLKYKSSYINTTAKDLVDCYITIFKNNILILEDDFVWLSNIDNKNYITYINDFCNNDNDFAFYLGTFPIIFFLYHIIFIKVFLISLHILLFILKLYNKKY